MGFRDLFKKNKKESSFSKNAKALGGVHYIIDVFWGEDGVKQVVSECKKVIDFVIEEGGVDKKTELLLGGADMTLEHFAQISKKADVSIGARNITAFIYYRYFLECSLALDTDIMDISEHYTLFQVAKHIPEGMHPYVQMMIKIYDLLDRGIIYLAENMDSVSKDYFPIVIAKIQVMLNEYEDDDTGWNKI